MNKHETDYYEMLLRKGFSYEMAQIATASTFGKPHLASEVIQMMKEENEMLYDAVFNDKKDDDDKVVVSEK